MNEQQEQELVRQAQAGDREALGTLWDFITPKLFGYLVNVTKDRALAEDLLQITWVRAIEALSLFQQRNGIKVSAWLFAIARNECKQHWRKANLETTALSVSPEPQRADHEQTTNNLLVEQILDLLSEDDRELLRLRYLADLTVKDIARILNVNSVTARVRLHRAIARARNTINSKNS